MLIGISASATNKATAEVIHTTNTITDWSQSMEIRWGIMLLPSWVMEKDFCPLAWGQDLFFVSGIPLLKLFFTCPHQIGKFHQQHFCVVTCIQVVELPSYCSFQTRKIKHICLQVVIVYMKPYTKHDEVNESLFLSSNKIKPLLRQKWPPC